MRLKSFWSTSTTFSFYFDFCRNIDECILAESPLHGGTVLLGYHKDIYDYEATL